MKKNKWGDRDRQKFADRDYLKAQSVPGKRRPPPHSDEWEGAEQNLQS